MNERVDIKYLDGLDNEELIPGQDDLPWVLFMLDNIAYGLNSLNVLSIEILGQTTPIVGDPPYMRGVCRFREDMISLVELRTLFGLGDRARELEDMMKARIQDHVNYVDKLEECVRTMTQFPLTTDPHSCKFGKWLYSYKTENNAISTLLKRVEKPHTHVHRITEQIKDCIAKRDMEGAQRKFREIKTRYFVEAVGLMEQIVPAFSNDNREMVIVVQLEGRKLGIIVDEILSVEAIGKFVDSHTGQTHSQYIEQIAKREKNEQTVMLLSESALAAL